MSQLTQHNEQDESAVVARILVTVHKSIDKRFPSMVNKSRQFSKTVFSNENTKVTDEKYEEKQLDSPHILLRRDVPGAGADDQLDRRMISERSKQNPQELEFDAAAYEPSNHTNVSGFYQLNSSPRLFGLISAIAFVIGAAVVIYLLAS